MATRRGPDGTVRVAIQGTRGGTNWANVFWCNLVGGATAPQANLDTWLTAFSNQYKTSFAPRQDSAVSYVSSKATLFQSGGTVLQSAATMTGTGTLAGTNMPENAFTKVISWKSTVYWRGGKPRTYSPGGTTADMQTSTTLTAAEVTALLTAAQGFRTAINALTAGAITGTTLGFVSFRSGNADRPVPLFFPITDAVIHHRAGTQRRRLGKWQL